MFKKLSFSLFVLGFSFNILSSSLPNREIIILLETINYETLDKTLDAPNIYKYKEILHPLGIGATTISLLIALYQQATPIIVNKSLLKNVIDHQNLFFDFVNLDRKSIFSKYGTYNRFRGRLTLDNFRNNCQITNRLTSEVNKMLSTLIKDGTNNFDKILNQIMGHKGFQGDSFSEVKQAIGNTSHIKSINLEMRMLILCSWIDFDTNWEIKQVNDDIFLLMPRNYIKNLNLTPNFNKAFQTNSAKLTDLELELGLKIDHLKTIKRSFFEQKSLPSAIQVPFSKSLERIFVTTSDLKKLNSKKNHIWSIYMSGHGLNKYLQLDILPQLYHLEKLYNSKLNSLESIKNIKNKYQVSTNQQEYIKRIKKLRNEIEKSKQIGSTNDKMYVGMINSLSIPQFKDVLKFFNTKIETAFLYYSSCFSAGPHLIEPYEENGKPLLLKYTVMTGTPAENMSLQEFPFINIPPYFTEKHGPIYEPLHISQIDIPNKKLNLTTPLNFGNFFKLLRKDVYNNLKNLVLLPYSLHPHVDQFGKIIPERIANIPLVRLANTNHFQPIPQDDSSFILNAKNNSNPISLNKNTALLYSDYVPGKVTIDQLGQDKKAPKLISMIPGYALHIFEEINSSTLTLKEIVNSFLTFSKLGSSKIFWVKNLECKNNNPNYKKEIVKDLIIMRNVFNSNALELCSDQDPMILENCAYFSKDTINESKLIWSGSFIDDYNYKIIPCNQSSHKEECLNSFPTAKKLVNPILQSI